LGIEDFDIEVEYQSDTIGKYDLEFNGKTFILKSKTTACLAQDACGIPSEKEKNNLIELGVNQTILVRQILDVANSICMKIKPITKDNFSELVIYGQGLATNIDTFQNDLPMARLG
jgi:hypothetical protein